MYILFNNDAISKYMSYELIDTIAFNIEINFNVLTFFTIF